MFKSFQRIGYFFEHLIPCLLSLGILVNCTNLDFLARINSIHVPTPAVTGENVILRCVYELGNETLYAVKWYKNSFEFFRYVPGSDIPFKYFPLLGVNVDVSKSDKSSIFLKNLSLESYGNYTCQVSTDRPLFRCVQTTKQLEVVVPPSDGPVLMEEKSEYELGDNVSILCNSGRSKPAPELKWYINDQLAQSELTDKETVVYPDQLESSSLVLRFRLKPDVLQNGRVVVKCVATVKHIHAVTMKEIIATGTKGAEPDAWLLLLTVMTWLMLQLTRA